jgi:phage terminase large subunit-like protein
MPKTSPCPVKSYADKVVRGKIPACKWVRLACERHIKDLKTARKRGLVWDDKDARFAISFFDLLKHSKGKWGGQSFDLSPWQQFIVGSLFGWKRKDGTRRFRIAYCEIPRKNGKSTLAAGIGLYLLVADGEPGAEVYSAATKRDQAKLTHSEAKRMVKSSRALSRKVRVYLNNLSIDRTNSKYEPLGADADSLDGLNPSGIICDELHAWKSRDLWDVLDTARGAREQPLTLAITTAGSNPDTICGEIHSFSKQVLDGTAEDDSHFAFICTIDEGDDWTDPKTWAKANPNLGVSISVQYLKEQLPKAKASIAAGNAFKRLYLNIWTRTVDGWLDMDAWNVCGATTFTREELRGKDCFGGLDLASTNDIAAFVLVFPWGLERGKPVWRCLAFFWVPAGGHTNRERRLREILAPWATAGFIKETDGDEIDFGVIESDIIALASEFNMLDLAYDPFNATKTSQNLQAEGITVTKFMQNITNYNEPSQLLESTVSEGRFHHGNNPVLRWMASNTASITDGRGYIMPSRKKSLNKIDGIPATVMALGRAMLHEDDTPTISFM